MIPRLIAALEALRRWLLDPTGELAEDDAAHAADTAELATFDARQAGTRHPLPTDCPLADCQTCEPDPLLVVSSIDPTEVGRQESEGAAILDIAAWLAASGFADMPVGERQRYAAWALKARLAYEKGTYSRV